MVACPTMAAGSRVSNASLSRVAGKRVKLIDIVKWASSGLSVDDEKQQKARRRDVSRFEQDMPERVPHILEKGSDKVAYDILKRLASGPKRPAELRAALGIASANFFTARYLTPLAKSGYIAVAGGEKNRYLPGKQYRILRKGKAVICA